MWWEDIVPTQSVHDQTCLISMRVGLKEQFTEAVGSIPGLSQLSLGTQGWDIHQTDSNLMLSNISKAH